MRKCFRAYAYSEVPDQPAHPRTKKGIRDVLRPRMRKRLRVYAYSEDLQSPQTESYDATHCMSGEQGPG